MWDQTALGNQPWGSCGGGVSTVPGVGRPWPPLSGEGREPQALGWLAFEPKWPEAPVVQRGCEGRERGRPRAGFLGGGRGGSVSPRDGSAWPGDQYLGWSLMGVLCGAHRRGHLGSLAVVVRWGEERWVQPWGTHPLPGHRHRRRAERPLPAAAVRCLPATRNPRSQGAWPLTPDPLPRSSPVLRRLRQLASVLRPSLGLCPQHQGGRRKLSPQAWRRVDSSQEGGEMGWLSTEHPVSGQELLPSRPWEEAAALGHLL